MKTPSHNHDPEFRAIADAALARWNEQRASLPKCGARKRLTGEPCQGIAMANGRCYRHGGRTPKGDGYHKPVWPDPKRRDATRKLERKLRALQKAERERAARVAEMTPDELAQYRKWQRSHKPGPPGPRALRRKEMMDGQALAAPVRNLESAEQADLQAEIDRLEAQARELEAKAAAPHDIFS